MRVGAWLSGALAACTIAACAPTGSPNGPTTGGLCLSRLAPGPPTAAAPSALSKIESHLTVDVALDTRRLRRELGQRVPVVLARAHDRSVGAAGLVTYVVRRGGFALRLRDERLVVDTPVSANVAVCKPIGPLCPVYGRCTPALISRVSLPVVLNPGYGLGPSRVSVAVTKPCVLEPIGLDVTPELERMARRQSNGLERRINSELPQLGPELGSAWRLLHSPIALGTTLCARITPHDVAQARPKLDGHTLSTELAVFGALSVEEPCQKNGPAGGALPAPKVMDRLPEGVDLEVPVRIDWTDVSADLTRSLSSGSQSVARITKVEARGARNDGADAILIDVTLEGTRCGDTWLFGQPYYDAASSRIRLRNVQFATGQRQRARALGAEALPAELERRAGIALPFDVSAGPRALENLVQQLTQNRPRGVRVTLEMKPARVRRVLLDERSLVPVASFDGSVRVEVE